MRRRGIIVGAGVALSTLAGCLGSEQVALSERPPENEVVDGIRTAIGEANTVALQLATAQEDAATPARVSFDAAALRDRLATATDELDAVAGTDAAGDYEAEVAEARSYVGVVEGILDGAAALADAATRLESIEASIQSGDHQAAAGELGSVQPVVDDARGTTTQAQSDAESLDAELLDPYGAVIGELTDGIETVQNVAVGADALAAGYEALLSGRERLESGQQEFEQGNVGAAESEFQAAQSQFSTATGHFETARDETDGELDAQVQTALCRSRALTEASGHFEDAAAAAQQGDFATAQRERDEGRADVRAAANC